MNFYLVNGFLGSGKTTAIANACKLLTAQSMKVAVITNDQGTQQVDSAYMQALTLPNAEVVNGCFCCRYNELEKAIAALKISAQPEIIFAESVGSCTDLIATIVKPFLLNHYKTKVVISVFADACLLHSIITGTSSFIDDSVRYIFKKQMEEADVLILNKTDLVTEAELAAVQQVIKARGYTCYACAICGNHIHLLIRTHKDDSLTMWNHFAEAICSDLRLGFP